MNREKIIIITRAVLSYKKILLQMIDDSWQELNVDEVLRLNNFTLQIKRIIEATKIASTVSIFCVSLL